MRTPIGNSTTHVRTLMIKLHADQFLAETKLIGNNSARIRFKLVPRRLVSGRRAPPPGIVAYLSTMNRPQAS